MFGLFNNLQGSDVGYGIAFLAGLLTFFSPCVLPIVPAYLAYCSGVSLVELAKADQTLKRFYQRKVFLHAFWFVLGFMGVFMVLGLATGWFGGWLVQWRNIMQVIGGILLIGLGLYLLEIFKLPALYKQAKFNFGNSVRHVQWLNALLTGVAFGFAWTPCIGPVLASILFLATWSGGSWFGVSLLFMFALGMSIPFLLSALLIQSLSRWLRRVRPFLPILQKMTGVMIITVGVLLILGWFEPIMIWLYT